VTDSLDELREVGLVLSADQVNRLANDYWSRIMGSLPNGQVHVGVLLMVLDDLRKHILRKAGADPDKDTPFMARINMPGSASSA
jgi:hypothetical protein